MGINKAAEEAALMELISNLALGFSVSLHPINLFFGFAGVTLGVIIGSAIVASTTVHGESAKSQISRAVNISYHCVLTVQSAESSLHLVAPA